MYDTRPPSSGSRFRWGAWIGGALGVLLLFTILGFCAATTTTPVDRIGVNYGGGPIEEKRFQKIIPAGSGITITGLMDPTYTYPITQRSYIISEGGGDVTGTVVAASKDAIRVEFETGTYFMLNTDLIQQFHERLGLKYQAWTDEGWTKLLNETLLQQIKFSIAREAAKAESQFLYADEPTKVSLQRSIGASLKENLHSMLGDDYFCGVGFVPAVGSSDTICPDFTFVVNKVVLPEAVETSLRNIQVAQNELATAQANTEVRLEEAKQIEAINAALAEAGDGYTLLKAVESGKVTFWVIESGTEAGLVVPTPTPNVSTPTTTTTVPAP